MTMTTPPNMPAPAEAETISIYQAIGGRRAEALFASALQRSDEPSAAQVRQAITVAVHAFGARGCAARVAQAYGEHPEIAVRGCAGRAQRSPACSARPGQSQYIRLCPLSAPCPAPAAQHEPSL